MHFSHKFQTLEYELKSQIYFYFPQLRRLAPDFSSHGPMLNSGEVHVGFAVDRLALEYVFLQADLLLSSPANYLHHSTNASY